MKLGLCLSKGTLEVEVICARDICPGEKEEPGNFLFFFSIIKITAPFESFSTTTTTRNEYARFKTRQVREYKRRVENQFIMIPLDDIFTSNVARRFPR